MAFSPDGKTILTGSDDGTARLWDAATGRPVGPPIRARGEDRRPCVAFSPDGKLVSPGAWTGRRDCGTCRYRPALGPPLEHRRPGLRRRVQPRRQDDPHRQQRPHGAALGRGHRDAHRRTRPPARHGRCRWRSAPTARPSSPVTTTVRSQLWDVATRGPSASPSPIPARSRPWPSAPTASRAHRVRGRHGTALGRGDRDTPAAAPCHMDAGSGPSPSAPTGDSSRPAMTDSVTALGRGDRPAHRPVLRHPGSGLARRVQPDGKTLLTGCLDGKARLFSPGPGSARRPGPRRQLGRGPHRTDARPAAGLDPAPRQRGLAGEPRAAGDGRRAVHRASERSTRLRKASPKGSRGLWRRLGRGRPWSRTTSRGSWRPALIRSSATRPAP